MSYTCNEDKKTFRVPEVPEVPDGDYPGLNDTQPEALNQRWGQVFSPGTLLGLPILFMGGYTGIGIPE